MKIDFDDILKYLNDEIGLNIDSIGILSISRGISTTMGDYGITDSNEFNRIVRHDSKIFGRLIENIKVPETWFFRDSECFRYLSAFIKEKGNELTALKPLRILSAPCSTGEEPYSAVMVALESGLKSDLFGVDGIDISRESIKIAKEGVYRKSSFRYNYDNLLDKYFSPIGNNFELDDLVKKSVNFLEGNIVKGIYADTYQKYDIIFCKNLLIYLNDEARKSVLENIKKLLKNDGIVLVGLSEINYFTRNGFEQIKYDLAFACRLRNTNFNSDYMPVKIEEIKSDPRIQKYKPKNEIRETNDSLKIEKNLVPIKDLEERFTIDNLKILANTGNFREAEVICNTLLTLYNDDVDVLYYMGLIQNALKNTELALNYFNKVVYLNPDHYESLIHISLIYDSMGNINQSELHKMRAEKVFLKSQEKIN